MNSAIRKSLWCSQAQPRLVLPLEFINCLGMDLCQDFSPEPCETYPECTEDNFISNWTEFCCQPEDVKATREAMLSVIGIVFVSGSICSLFTLSTFIYLSCLPERIQQKFGQEFTMIRDPVFYLIMHLNFSDFLYCIFGNV